MKAFLFAFLVPVCFSVVIDKPESHSWAWEKTKRSDPNAGIDLLFALKQQNVDVLIETLLAVSTPSNERYGEHLSQSEVQNLVRPSIETTNAVKNWLTSFDEINLIDIHNATPNGDFLKVSTRISVAEKILNTKYYDYRHKYKWKSIVPRVDHELDYNVPESVANHLDFVSPTKRFPSPLNVTASTFTVGANTPTNLRQLYAVGDVTGKASNNLQAVASFLEQYYSKNDLNEFWKRYNIPQTTVTNVPTNQSSGRGAEAELDVQYITAMGEKIPTQVWYTPGRAPNNHANEPFLTWLLNVENYSNPPSLFSVSYGEDEKSVGYDYGSRVNTEFAKLGTQGVSFLFASGDSGAGGNCSHSKGRECPNFPTGSPYVTSIGGTQGGTAGKTPTGESAWRESGGGFSDYWPTQSWQSDAISTYFTTASNKLPPANKYNQTGRGYPDISAQSVDFTIIDGGIPIGVSGTSCATPTCGGIFGLLNDLRFQNNMKPLGFLNPFIYETAAKDSLAFNDVIKGSNVGCGGDAFPAVEKWDAVTGWGTPDYAKLATYTIQTGLKTIRK